MAVQPGPTEQRYVGNGVTTIFTVPFLVIQASDLAVYVDGVLLTSDYTQTGAGNPTSTVTFTSAPAALSQILLQLDVPFERLNDYQENGDFLASTVNRDYDRIWQALKQLLRSFGRSLSLGQFDIDGQGWYRAKGNGIRDLADPVQPQDAATKNSVEEYVSSILETGQGPINNAQNVVYVYPDNIARPLQTLADKTNTTLGAAGIGYRGRTVGAKFSERLDVTDFWQLGDASWSDAIDRCIAIAESASSTSTGPSYTVPKIWFPRSFDPSGTYGILRPIRTSVALQFDGDNARIVTLPGFVGATIPLQAGGTEINKSMMIFLNGSKGNIAGQLRWKAKVGKGIILDCQDIADRGIYIERMAYSSIDCEIQFAAGSGVQVGPYCWGIGFDGVVIENFTLFGIHFLKDSAANGMSIRNPRIWGEFKTSVAGIVFDQDSEANGVVIEGGFIEKIDYGVLVSQGNGPMSIIGVDFEQCTFACVRAAAGSFAGQKIGPVDVTNCFLHTNTVGTSKIYADHATINVSGCRMFPANFDFETDNSSRGIINASNNRYMAGGTVGIGANVSLAYTQNDGVTKEDRNYLPQKNASFSPTYAMKNYAYRDSPFLQSSGIVFAQSYQGGPTGQYLGFSEWYTAEYRHISAPGVINQRIGLRLANDTGQNAVQPLVDGGTSCGSAAARWTQVYAFNATINTSDARSKEQIRDVSEAEIRVAGKLKKMVKAYRMTDSVDKQGPEGARIHFGLIAQDVKAVFEDEGLDPFAYSLLCYDKWDDVWRDIPEEREQVLTTEPTPAFSLRDPTRPILDRDGNQLMSPPGQPIFGSDGQPMTRVVKEATRELVYAAGDRYGIRYEELLAFIISAM
ncbi:MAG: hypothetical protein GAK37_00276 [Pseudomonas sp.]|nr:MAG: hypothetical protein GAK37_00276 [Pseudomonas sp.]